MYMHVSIESIICEQVNLGSISYEYNNIDAIVFDYLVSMNDIHDRHIRRPIIATNKKIIAFTNIDIW